MTRNNQKRLNMYIPLEIYKKMEEKARLRNISKTLWVIRAIVDKVKNDLINE